jgi:hypothetical protein
MPLPNRRACCYNPEPDPDFIYCPKCGLPLKMRCPSCSDDTLIPLVVDGHSAFECTNSPHHLLKHCPECGKLHSMDAHTCDQRACRNAELDAPTSSWADVHGGVCRRRLVKITKGLHSNSNRSEKNAIATIAENLPNDIGDTIISAYGRLYLDNDPYISMYRPNSGGKQFPETIHPIPSDNAIAVHSGMVAVLGGTNAFLFSSEGSTLANIEITAVNQLLLNNRWWLITDRDVYTLTHDEAKSVDPYSTLVEQFQPVFQGTHLDILPPVLIDDDHIWIVNKTGEYWILNPDGVVKEGNLKSCFNDNVGEIEVFGALRTSYPENIQEGSLVALCRIRQSGVGDICKLQISNINKPDKHFNALEVKHRFLQTWCMSSTGIIHLVNDGELFSFNIKTEGIAPSNLTFTSTESAKSLAYLEGESGYILAELNNGTFRIASTNGSTWRSWNPEWDTDPRSRRIYSWTIWGDSIVAVIRGDDGCQLVRIPAEIEL